MVFSVESLIQVQLTFHVFFRCKFTIYPHLLLCHLFPDSLCATANHEVLTGQAANMKCDYDRIAKNFGV